MNRKPTIILTGSEVASLLPLEECIAAVEKAFKSYAEGSMKPPGILGMHVEEGGYHIKAGVMDHFVAKINANFPKNQKQFGLPTIQGVVTVYDISNGQLLSLMDSSELTIIRTGAATAVGAKYLAKEDADTATIIGCGAQGRISLRMLMKVRDLKTVFIHDLNRTAAEKMKKDLEDLEVSIIMVDNYKSALAKSDICITCTTSKKPLLQAADIIPGTFIAAVGSDNEDKQELHPQLLASNKVVADVIDQCAEIGELHHALEAGLMAKDDVHAELGDVIAGRIDGRKSDDEIIIFDSTGTGLQDVASASIVYEKAVEKEMGLRVFFRE